MSEAKKCKKENCKRAYRAKGYCGFHYREWRHGKLPHQRFKSCHAEDCHKPMTPNGMCAQHAGGPEAPAEAPKEAPKEALKSAPPPAAAAPAPATEAPAS